MSVIIVGGGLAGFSLAGALQRRGLADVTLVEQEALPFAHSSGRNAAIFRPVETSPVITELARHTRALMDDLDDGLVTDCGLVLTAASEAALQPLANTADACGVDCQWLRGQDELVRYAPLLRHGRARFGLRLPGGGVIDIHRLTEALRRRTLDAGLTLRLTTQAVTWSRTSAGFAVKVGPTETLRASRLVLAGGGWAAQLGALGGAPLPLVPHRRHLAHVMPPIAVPPAHPVCWNVETDLYFRPESEGILACAGDHEPHAPGLPSIDGAQLERLAEQLPLESPELATSSIRRAWACLRTMAPDGHMVLGPDPRCENLFWFAGLAGHGMTAGLAAAELVADAACLGRDVAPPLGVSRWLAG